MFCRFCGKKVLEDSLFCSFCGKQLRVEEQKEETIPVAALEPTANSETETNVKPTPAPEAIEPKSEFKSDPEFVWDLHEFPSSKKTEDIAFEWQTALRNTQGLKAGTIAEAEAKAKKEAEAAAEKESVEPKPFTIKPLVFSELRPEIRKEPEPEIRKEPELTAKEPEPELIAKEPEPELIAKEPEIRQEPEPKPELIAKAEITEEPKIVEPKISTIPEIEPFEAIGIFKQKEQPELGITLDDIKKELETTKAEQGFDERIDKFYTFNQKNEEFQKLLDREYEKARNKGIELEAEAPEPIEIEPEVEAIEDQSELDLDIALESDIFEALKEEFRKAKLEIEVAEAQAELIEAQSGRFTAVPKPTEAEEELVAEEELIAEDELIAEEEAEPEDELTAEEQPAEEQPVTPKDLNNLIYDNDTLAKKFDTKEFNADLIEAALAKAGIKVASDSLRNFDSEETEHTPKYESDFKPKFITESEIEEEAEEAEDELIAEEEEQDQDWQSDELHEFEEDVVLTDPQKQQAFKELEQMWNSESEESKKESKKDDFFRREGDEEDDEDEAKKGRASGIIIFVLVSLLAIQSSILGIIHFAPESRAAEFVNRELGFAITWFANIRGGGGEQVPDVEDVFGTGPEADKGILIEGQLHHNTNIFAITPNPDLGLDPDRAYPDSRIPASVPIENNVWITTDEERYFDQQVVAIIIKFNSMWIDFVNVGNPRILELVMVGSPMEQSLLTFSGFGEKIHVFTELQIGEIRQYENSFFVWVHEIVSDAQDGQALVRNERARIYEIRVRDDSMYIVAYFTGQ